jgi:integrase
MLRGGAVSRINLTDRFIKSRRPAEPGTRDEYPDAIVPGLALRVTDKGSKSFVLIARYPKHPKNPTRRAIGRYGAIGLEDARQRARQWLALIDRGIDPEIENARERAAACQKQTNTFGAVVDAYLDGPASKLRHAKQARTIIESEFKRRWAALPIVDIRRKDVAAAIEAIVNRGAPYQAHNALGHLRSLFNWAVANPKFGIDLSPVDGLRPAKLIGRKEVRTRVLRDEELRAAWEAAGAMGYPYGPVFRLLILTGQRETEVSEMAWPELDLANRLWTVPAARMKGGAAHEVPLSPAAVALIGTLPRFTTGDFVFTTTTGAKPINGFSKAKARIDRLSGVAEWRIHDLRRTMRTHLSALPVQDLVRELVIAHAKPGLHKVYDQHVYQAEKRECLVLWERRLMAIVEPPSCNELAMPTRAAGSLVAADRVSSPRSSAPPRAAPAILQNARGGHAMAAEAAFERPFWNVSTALVWRRQRLDIQNSDEWALQEIRTLNELCYRAALSELSVTGYRCDLAVPALTITFDGSRLTIPREEFQLGRIILLLSGNWMLISSARVAAWDRATTPNAIRRLIDPTFGAEFVSIPPGNGVLVGWRELLFRADEMKRLWDPVRHHSQITDNKLQDVSPVVPEASAIAFASRRPGRTPTISPTVVAAMTRDIEAGQLTLDDLCSITQDALAAQYGASRKTVVKARDEVISMKRRIASN